jgi:hypothetical protein
LLYLISLLNDDGLLIKEHDDAISASRYALMMRRHGQSAAGKAACFEDGGRSVEAGVLEMADRMRGGRWKVFKGQNDGWMQEVATYHSAQLALKVGLAGRRPQPNPSRRRYSTDAAIR